jgi:hypothetical protein
VRRECGEEEGVVRRRCGEEGSSVCTSTVQCTKYSTVHEVQCSMENECRI